jgi:hypothetical protein
MRTVVFCLWLFLWLFLFLGIAAGGVLFGPGLTADLARGGRTFEMTKRKLEALRSFALFRSRGDKAVLRWGEPPGRTRSKKPPNN